MPPTEIADLTMAMEALLAEAGARPDEPAESAEPTPRSFAAVYGSENRGFAQMAAEAEAAGDIGLAGLLRALEAGFAEGRFDLPAASAPALRLTRFVYPVV